MIFCSVFSPRKPVGNSLRTAFCPGREGGTPHMKVVGMHVVSLRGVKFRFWSYLSVLGKTLSYLAVEVSFKVARQKI